MTGGLAVADACVGAALLSAPLVVWQRDGSAARLPRAGLLAAAAVAWEAGSILRPGALWHRALLLHLVLLPARGRLRSPWRRGLVVAGYLLYAVPGTLPNGAVSGAVGITLMVAALHPYARRQRGPRPARIGAAGPLLLAAALVWQPLASADGAASEARLVLGYDALVVLLAAGLVLAVTVDGSRVERLVVDLGASESDLLRDRLARALRDPTLTVGYWLAERSVYVDDSGAQVHLPAPGEARSATPIAMEGRPLALLVHDEAVSTDAGLLRDVAAAARWAVENIRLREQVRAQVAVVDASRRRLVTAGDEERRRLEDSLRVGPQRRLTAVRSLLADGADWQGLVASLEHAERDLVDLANGLHPRVLTDGGLQPALAQLADFCPVPVALHAPDMRLPGPVESALYFSCAEALTNVAKYAQARAVHVHITVVGGEAVLVVDDDGVGGAQLDGGSGLRGLGDRVDALGGRLVLVSQPGRGTQVTVRLPLRVGAMS